MRAVRAQSVMFVEPSRVIRAFLDPIDLQGWWRADRTLVEPQVNGLYAIGWGVSEKGYQYVSTGTIVALDPDRELRIDHFTYFNPEHGIFGPMELEVSAERVGLRQTRATVLQSGYRDGAAWDWFYNAVVDGWPLAVDYLRQYLEHPTTPK